MPNTPLRVRLASALLGKQKGYIPSLAMYDTGGMSMDFGGRLMDYGDRREQLNANVGWCYAANSAIVDPTAAVTLKLYRKQKDGDRDEIFEHELLDLLDAPNMVHTGEQFRQLHYTYMNFVGESYIYMMKGGNAFEPGKGKLPDALHLLPSHLVQFDLGATYTSSVVRYASEEYPLTAFIRDLNPDPANPYRGRSIRLV